MIVTASWITPKVMIVPSDISGKGLFAIAVIKKNEKVVVWKGNYFNKKEADKVKREGKLVMQWDEDLFSVEDRGDDIAYFINHSCDPNLWMQDAYILVARRDIKKGEEITADYALWEADQNYVSKWQCVCGSSLCRKRITGRDWCLPELQKRYKGHFSPLINKRIERIEL